MAVLWPQDKVAGAKQSPICVDILRINERLQFLDEIRQFVRAPLDGLLQYVVETLAGIVGPIVTACGDVVTKEMNDSTTQTGIHQ